MPNTVNESGKAVRKKRKEARKRKGSFDKLSGEFMYFRVSFVRMNSYASETI